MMEESDKVGRSWQQDLSDLADGRAGSGQARALAAAWKGSPALRRDWHAIHLIGDTLRSAELAQEARPAADFLAEFRGRLAAEPVPIRPRQWQAWLAPLAVAASFVVVALAVPGLQSMLKARPGGEQFALQAPAPWPAGAAAAGSTLAGNQPSFAQSMVEPAVPVIETTWQPAGRVEAVAPFELAVPAVAASAPSPTPR